MTADGDTKIKTVTYLSMLSYKVGEKVLLSEHGMCTVLSSKPRGIFGDLYLLSVDEPNRQREMITYAEWMTRRQSQKRV